jgi:hypothetical protein
MRVFIDIIYIVLDYLIVKRDRPFGIIFLCAE